MIKNKYIFISWDELSSESVSYAFNIYSADAAGKTFTLLIPANFPLVEKKRKSITEKVKNGLKLAITDKQLKTFQRDTGIKMGSKEAQAQEQAQEQKQAQAQEQKQAQAQEQKQAQVKSATASHDPSPLPGTALEEVKSATTAKAQHQLQQSFSSCLQDEDFGDHINLVRNEILEFKKNASHTTSLAQELAEKFLFMDDELNRTVALCYTLAKCFGIKSQEELGDLVSASFLHHVGLTQLEESMVRSPSIKLGDKQKKMYQKHPALAKHLIKLCALELSPRCVAIIADHHERIDGSGYPQGIEGQQLSTLAQILGIVSHTMDYSLGRVVSKKTPLKMVISFFKAGTKPQGIEAQFDPALLDCWTQLANSSFSSKPE